MNYIFKKSNTNELIDIDKEIFKDVIQQLLSKKFEFNGDSQYYLSIKVDDIRTEIHSLKNIQL